ncbi:transcriptional regulator [Salmonella enterica subsp. enterica]|uniref:Transcriptional regulator n=1 Tax=Salmonella enterica I TaxID=59201 RepID=A0A379WR67_SALET|nr:transcriptional regulator [Salmonella enterica subsp. enterica]
MHITLRQLEVFAEVLKSGSTTQASVMLSLSQSAVSAALTDLEGQLGVQLLIGWGNRLVVIRTWALVIPARAGIAGASGRKLSSYFVRITARYGFMPVAPSAITFYPP